jgi:dTDP-4-amino-4,6-dideoxygalactose transaminase
VIPFSRPTIGQEEIDEVVGCLRSGWVTTGPLTARFEKEFADYVGARHALAVSSATAGLHLALLALKLRPDDEVITSPMTWPATVNTIVLAGGTPVFADIEPETLNLDVRSVERKLSSRTRAILPVHFAGQPCAMKDITEIAEARGLHVLEDAAHAVGAEVGGRRIGSVARAGDAAVFSFHPIKNITTGEGGMVTTDDEDLVRRLRLLRFHGVERDAWKAYDRAEVPHYDVTVPGLKYNLTDLQSAIGIHQLRRLDSFIARRAELARYYDERLSEIPEIHPLGRVPYPVRHAHHLYVVRLDAIRLDIDRDGFVAEVQAQGIGLGLHFTAVHQLSYYRRRFGDLEQELPIASDASRRIFSLPLYPSLTTEDLDVLIDTLERTLRAHRH